MLFITNILTLSFHKKSKELVLPLHNAQQFYQFDSKKMPCDVIIVVNYLIINYFNLFKTLWCSTPSIKHVIQ